MVPGPPPGPLLLQEMGINAKITICPFVLRETVIDQE